MAVASVVGFKWLDILEKEFDNAFVDLDVLIAELESDEPDTVYSVRQKLCTLSSCFAQLAHKAQTVFQNSAKTEAELIHMRTELVNSESMRVVQKQELHRLLLQMHTSNQLAITKKDYCERQRLQEELEHFTNSNSNGADFKFSPTAIGAVQLKAENQQLHTENTALRRTQLALESDVYGAKLAAKYLDKELAGRIQQLQLLLGREGRTDLNGTVREKLWRQLEAEILLQRHKTVLKACRSRHRRRPQHHHDKIGACQPQQPLTTPPPPTAGVVRTVKVSREPHEGLGISVTGGREHGVAILISDLEAAGPAARTQQLHVGDAILQVDEQDLRRAPHKEAVQALQGHTGDCTLLVQYVTGAGDGQNYSGRNSDTDDADVERDSFRFFENDDELAVRATSEGSSEITDNGDR